MWGSILASLVVLFFIRNVRAVIITVARDPGVDHRDVHADAGDELHAEQHDAARPHARRRHRHRRRDRRAGEHLPVHRGEELHALRGRHPGHARGDARRHGDDAVARRHLPAGGVHDRLHAPVRQPVRLDDGVLDPGVDVRELHADADAELADAQARPASAHKTKESRFFEWRGPRATRGRCSGRSITGGSSSSGGARVSARRSR